MNMPIYMYLYMCMVLEVHVRMYNTCVHAWAAPEISEPVPAPLQNRDSELEPAPEVIKKNIRMSKTTPASTGTIERDNWGPCTWITQVSRLSTQQRVFGDQ